MELVVDKFDSEVTRKVNRIIKREEK